MCPSAGVPGYTIEQLWSKPLGEGWPAERIPIEDSDDEDEWGARMRAFRHTFLPHEMKMYACALQQPREAALRCPKDR